jgi:hypothetical protein
MAQWVENAHNTDILCGFSQWMLLRDEGVPWLKFGGVGGGAIFKSQEGP